MPESIFTITTEGVLMELDSIGWRGHGHPPGCRLSILPAAVLVDLDAVGSLFFRCEDGSLSEYWHDANRKHWKWLTHGFPVDTTLATAPSEVLNRQSMFAIGANSKLYERAWRRNKWMWVSHSHPKGYPLADARPVYLDASHIICLTISGRLAGRVMTPDQRRWMWEVYQVP